MRGLAVALIAVAACGRLDFDVLGGGGGGGGGGGDGGGSDGPAPACLATYQLCDGFEGGSFASVWTVQPGATIDTSVHHRGLASAHFTMPGTTAGSDFYTDLTETTTLPLAGPTFYVRAYVLLGSNPLDNMELIAAQQQNTGNPNEDGVFVDPEDLAIFSQFSNRDSESSAPPPTGSWLCLVWSLTRATDTSGMMTLGGDVQALARGNVVTDGTPPLSEMAFGIGFAGPSVLVDQPPIELWIDDVIIANTPLTCAD